MAEIFIVHTQEGSLAPLDRNALSELDFRRWQQAGSKQLKDQLLLSRSFLQKILKDFYLLKSPPILKKNSKGKPFLEGLNYKLAMSHSQDYIVFVISKNGENVSVDIETKIKESSYIPLAKRHFHKEEQEYIESFSKKQQAFAFRQIWTLKESYYKYLNPSDISLTKKLCFFLNSKPQLQRGLDPLSFEFYNYEDVDFSLSLCCERGLGESLSTYALYGDSFYKISVEYDFVSVVKRL